LHWDGVDELKAETNYFFGRGRSGWYTHVGDFDSVRASDVMPGVDVVMRSAAGAMSMTSMSRQESTPAE
jgi:hypothetical protein